MAATISGSWLLYELAAGIVALQYTMHRRQAADSATRNM
jgi:hypothetical protein